jgi:hypothetical protein
MDSPTITFDKDSYIKQAFVSIKEYFLKYTEPMETVDLSVIAMVPDFNFTSMNLIVCKWFEEASHQVF